MKSSEPRVGVVEVLEDHDDRAGLGEPLEEGPPGAEQLLGRHPGLEPEQRPGARARSSALVGRRERARASVAATLARVVGSSSVSTSRHRPRTISPSAQKRDARRRRPGSGRRATRRPR